MSAEPAAEAIGSIVTSIVLSNPGTLHTVTECPDCSGAGVHDLQAHGAFPAAMPAALRLRKLQHHVVDTARWSSIVDDAIKLAAGVGRTSHHLASVSCEQRPMAALVRVRAPSSAPEPDVRSLSYIQPFV